MKIDGWLSMRDTPSLSAVRAPSTATRSPRRSWPPSNVRPVTTFAPTASSRPPDAATSAGCAMLAVDGSLTGTAVMVSSPRSTAPTSPASSTPTRRRARSGESQGRRVAAAVPPDAVRTSAGVIVTCVAATASNCRAMRWEVVCANPNVTTSAAIPSTVPDRVMTSRPGRAPTPERASTMRS